MVRGRRAGCRHRGAGRLVVQKFADQKITLADAHGIAIMRKRRITSCWSTDRHLTLGGAALAI